MEHHRVKANEKPTKQREKENKDWMVMGYLSAKFD
jgi:hypothetical protein